MGRLILTIAAVVLLSANNIPPNQFRNIVNRVNDPCISYQVDFSVSGNMVNEISELIRNFYAVSDTINLTIDQTYDLDASVNAITKCYHTGDTPSIYIYFNGNTMPNASKEYITATLYHEFLHAILFFNGTKDIQQHEPIATSYRKILTQTLLQHFPDLSKNEASSLAWEGLHETEAWSTLFQSHQLSILKNNRAFKSGKKGSKCK